MNSTKLRLGLFAVSVALVVVNAFAIWGVPTARLVDSILQIGAGAGALVCGVIVARRVIGSARAWRLLVLGGMTASLVGEAIWRSNGSFTGSGLAPLPGVIANFFPPLFVVAALLTLAYTSGALPIGSGGPLRHSVVIYVLDGVVAASSFSILVIMGLPGALVGAAIPRSGNHTVALVYALTETLVVVTAVLVAMAYRTDRPYRLNYLILAGGVVLIASSDRLVAYLRSVGADSGELWAGAGFPLGLLIIGYALLEWPKTLPNSRTREALDWLQLALPYIGFLGISILLAFHLLIGQTLSSAVIYLVEVIVLLVATRQVVAMRAQKLLTERLYLAQSGLAHQVHHDVLTGLPNRLLFSQRLENAVRDGKFVLIFVDLDDFKEVNDRFGHAAGDALLRAVGDRLRQCVRQGDTLARIGGDEFAILIEGEPDTLEVIADRIRVALRDPFAVQGSSVRVRASMGLVRGGGHGESPTSDELLRQADVSMYAGKRQGKDIAVVYQPLSALTTDFPTVLKQADGGVPDGFSLVYQTVVRLPDETPTAVEALARWTAPNGTEIPPETFVAAAEATGLGAALDLTVLDLACAEMSSVRSDLALHVNIGAARLGNRGFEQRVLETLARHGVAPERLVVEITETVPIVDLSDAAAQIRRLNATGIRIALDDFGAGYNSLTYLHVLPVQIIKLDRGLAVGAEPARDGTLYRSVMKLCETLNLDVIAEGIESTTQLETIVAAGCRLAQGYLFGYPVPISEISCEPPLRSLRSAP